MYSGEWLLNLGTQMHDRACLVIDDVEAALATLTELGKTVLTEPSKQVRAAVLAYATRRGWLSVSHGSFMEWALSVLAQSEIPWVVLDPLIPLGSLPVHAFGHRVSRVHSNGQMHIAHRGADLSGRASSASVGILDDVASSGGTLAHVVESVVRSGGRVDRIALCASSRRAQDIFWAARRDLFVPGDCRAIHLRDGCPHLAFSGRSTGESVLVGADSAKVELRMPTNLVLGNLWQVLAMDSPIAEAQKAARTDVIRNLRAAIGREPVIADLLLLGKNVPALWKAGVKPVAGDYLNAY